MAVRILHAADFHLDSPFYALSDEKSAERRQECRQLLMKVAELAESEKAQLVLLSGDLFDSQASYWETQEMLKKMLSAIKVPVFIAPGNHDYYSQRSPYSFMELPENVHVFTSPTVRCVELPELGCRVWGAGFTAPVCDSVLRGFSVGRSNLIDIMVLHGDVGGDRYNGISEADIAGSGLSYLALGHVHSFSGIKTAGDTRYAYPGCLTGRGFDETGAKGVICGTVSKDKCDLRFVPVPSREYRICEIDVSGSENIAKTVMDAVSDIDPQHIVRALLRGEAGEGVKTAYIEAAMLERFYSANVKDETIPAVNIWAGVGDDSLSGLFLKRLKDKYDAAGSEQEKKKYLAAARYGIAAMKSREVWQP